MGNPVGPAESRYYKLEKSREPFLKRARKAAELTIPSLIPPEGHSKTSELPHPWQSVGSRGVNNLASKLVMVMMPPNQPFFRVMPAFMEIEELKEQNPELGTQLEKALGKYEQAVKREIDSSNDRVAVFEAKKHLIIAGNVLLVDTPKDGMKVVPLTRYVVRRDPMGNVLEIVTKETISPDILPDEVQSVIQPHSDNTDKGGEKFVDLYTHVKREGDKFTVYQEAAGVKVPGSEGSYPIDASAFMPLRFNRIDGEDYGRGYIEDLIGDLISLDGLEKAIVEGSAGAARLLLLVNPNGSTKQEDIAKAENGAVRSGRADDVTVVQMNKAHDFQTAANEAAKLERRIEMAFLMNSSVQRDAERVTAEEIRFVAQELEEVFGGLYSILAKEFQMMYLNRKIHKMERAGKLPVLPKKDIRISIITGLEALGRGHDLQKLNLFIQGAHQDIGPEAVVEYVRVGDYLTRRATALGIDTEGLIRTEEEIEAKREQMLQAQIAQQFGPELIKQGGSLIQEGVKQSGQQRQGTGTEDQG